MTQLLVSVRSATEAEAALEGGAHLIDVKEPAHGSLGRAPEQVIGEVLRVVAGRVPVSAALGELSSDRDLPLPAVAGLAFAKWGLAGLPNCRFLDEATVRLHGAIPGCRPVAVAYGDYQRASSPAPAETLTYALVRRQGAFLIDTFVKDGGSLLDHLRASEIVRLCRLCQSAGLPIAVAGALGHREIGQLAHAKPSWFAVRGAVCRGGDREATIDASKVRCLVDLLKSCTANAT